MEGALTAKTISPVISLVRSAYHVIPEPQFVMMKVIAKNVRHFIELMKIKSYVLGQRNAMIGRGCCMMVHVTTVRRIQEVRVMAKTVRRMFANLVKS